MAESAVNEFMNWYNRSRGSSIYLSKLNRITIHAMDNSDGFENAESMDELRELLQKKTDKHNNTVREELGGLSPIQARTLLTTAWKDPSCPLRLNDSLSAEAVKQTEIMQNAQLLINYIKQREPLPTTGTGNFKRDDVDPLLKEMVPPSDRYVEKLRDINKVINEQDVVPLHTIKTVLEIGELLIIRNNEMRVPEQTAELVAEERFEELFAELFRVYFREYNIAYYTRGPELNEIQDTIEITFYKLHQLNDEWYSEDTLTNRVAHPTVLEQYSDTDLDRHGNPLPLVYTQRVYNPLVRFGLLEKRNSNRVFRKTKLFDRFLSFDFE